MREIPDIEVIGNGSEEEKENLRKRIEKNFLIQSDTSNLPEKQKEIINLEIEKTPEQLAVIDFINNETNRLMEDAGIEPFDIPYGNFHILPEEAIKKINYPIHPGQFSPSGQAIVLLDSENKNILTFSGIALHEALHMKAKRIWKISEHMDNNVKHINTGLYRSGVEAFSASSKKDPHVHFSGLDEAIVTKGEMQLLRKIIDLPELKEEKEKLLKLKVKIEEIAKSENSSPEEIYDIKEEDGKIIDYKVIGYKPQMKVLDFVCETIAKELKKKYFRNF